MDLHIDINKMTADDLPWHPDLILASPPCEKFSVMTIGRNWTLDHQPKTEGAKEAIKLVQATVRLIHELNPNYFVIENPRAKLRKLDLIPWERRTITYCQFGEKFMKPTDLWGGFPPSLELPAPCKNGAPCHTSASRGSTTGIQGDDRKRTKFRGGMIEDMSRFPSWSDERKQLTALRAKIPYELSLMMTQAAEHDFYYPYEVM